MRLRFLLLIPIVLAASLLGFGDRRTSWAVSGVLTEACECAVHCQCDFGQMPSFDHCDDATLWTIEKGHYGEVDLARQKFAVVVRSPDHAKLSASAGNMAFARIYIPSEANAVQAAALAGLARRIGGKEVRGKMQLAANEEVVKTSVNAWIEPTHHRVWIPGVLNLEIDSLVGEDGKTPWTVKTPDGSEITVARSKVYTFHDALSWDHSGRSASIRRFKLEGKI